MLRIINPALLIAGTLLYCLQADAQNSGQENQRPKPLDTMIVTGSLEPRPAAELGSFVTVITREMIQQKQARYLADILRDVPGFAVSQAGGSGAQTQIRVRGAEANHILVLVDGVRANDPASGDEFQFQYALTSNIDRIEIIRGPQSAIWGSDALAGVINIIRRRDFSGNHFNASTETGSFGSTSLSLDGGFNGDTLSFSGGISRFDTDGTNISRGGNEDDGAENTTANASLEFTINDSLNLAFSGQYVDNSSQFDDIDFFVTGLPVDADMHSDSSRYYLRGEARFSPSQSWSNTFSVDWLETDNENFNAGLSSSSNASERLALRLRSSLSFGGGSDDRHRLSFALDREDIDFSQRGIASPFGDPNQDQSYDDTAYALEYINRVSGRFTWSLSGRYDDFSAFDNASSYQLGGSYKLDEDLRLRAAVSSGTKTPTFTERFGFFADFFAGNPNLKPESSTSWEIGLEKDWSQGRYHLGLTYFDQKLEDEIDGFVFDPASGLFTAENKTADSKRRGVELLLDMKLLPGLSLRTAYTYTDASETGPLGAQVEEVRRPEHMASVLINYDFLQGKGQVNLSANYNGSQLDNFFSPSTFLVEKVEIPNFTVVDLAGSWKISEKLEIFGRINNLLDEDYEEVLGFRRPGRAAYAGLRGRFGH